MNAILMAVTVTCAVFNNSFRNTFSKKYLKNNSDNLAFNLIGNILVMIVTALFGGMTGVSGYTLLLAFGMGTMNLICSLLFSMALTCGPMALSTLVELGISLIGSALLGPLFFQEGLRMIQVIGIVLILASMVLTSNTKTDKNITPKWLFCTVLAGVINISLGLFQKLLNLSPYADQQMGFLFYTFLICSAANIIWLLIRKKKHDEQLSFDMRGRVLIYGLIIGITVGAQHIINLKLVGQLPTAVFFPICTGLRILLTALVGIILFREKLSMRQLIGFIIGFGAMFLVAGVF